jgi:hypothetical protein
LQPAGELTQRGIVAQHVKRQHRDPHRYGLGGGWRRPGMRPEQACGRCRNDNRRGRDQSRFAQPL